MLAVIPLATFAQSPPPLSSYQIQNWQSDSGLPQDTVNAIVQTRDGFLWIGTDGGLARFDGVEFQVFDRRTTPAFQSDSIRSLHERRDGALRIETGAGVVDYSEGAFHAERPESGSSVDIPLSAGIYDTEWAVTPQGLQESRKGVPSRLFTVRDGLPSTVITEMAVQGGKLFLATQGGLATLREDRIERIGPAQRIGWLLPDEAGYLWVAGELGVMRIAPDGAVTELRNPLLTDARTIYQDREGNVWVGTASAGLTVLRIAPVALLAAYPDFGALRTIAMDAHQNIWLGQDGGLSALESGAQAAREASPPLHGKVLALAATPDALWIGTTQGLVQRGPGHSRTFTTADGLPDDSVRSLFVDKDSTVWAGTRHGLGHLVNGRFETFTRMDGLADDLVGSIVRDAQGTLWVATLNGLSRLDGDHFVAAPREVAAGAVTALAVSGGELWIGTDHTLTRVTGASVRRFDTETAYGILPGTGGHIWLNTRHGVVRLSPASGEQREFSTAEASTGGHPTSFSSPDGTLWFATLRGITRIVPDAGKNAVAPLMAVEGVDVDDVAVPYRAGVVVPPGRHRLAIHYAALSFRAPQLVFYRYELSGLDRGWVEAGSSRTANYNDVPPGRYRFEVSAADIYGLASPVLELRVTAQPRFVQTWWFFAMCVLTAALLLFLVYRWREAYLAARHRAVLDERVRIAREIHDTLAQGYVALAVQADVALRLMDSDRTAAVSTLRTMRQMMKDGLDQARSSIWNLRSEAEERTLPAEISAAVEKASAAAGIPVTLEVHGSYREQPAEREREVLRIAQEALANIHRHAEATAASVALTYDGNSMVLEIFDNGRGFSAQEAAFLRGHFGVRGMRERAERLGGSLKIESGTNAGTRVAVRVPLVAADVPEGRR